MVLQKKQQPYRHLDLGVYLYNHETVNSVLLSHPVLVLYNESLGMQVLVLYEI